MESPENRNSLSPTGSNHARILAILFGVVGALSFLISIGPLLLVAIPKPNEGPEMTPILNRMLAVFGSIGLFFSAPTLLASWALLQGKRWARTYSLILSVLFLFNIPLGTALGGYGLWVLSRPVNRKGSPEVATSGTLVSASPGSATSQQPATISFFKTVLVLLVGTVGLTGGLIYGGTGPSGVGVVVDCWLRSYSDS
jgi:hypothetical protein